MDDEFVDIETVDDEQGGADQLRPRRQDEEERRQEELSFCDLLPFTSYHPLRQVEEHGQYDSSRASDRKFKCEYCDKRFQRKEDVVRHERSHTNERNYKCRSAS